MVRRNALRGAWRRDHPDKVTLVTPPETKGLDRARVAVTRGHDELTIACENENENACAELNERIHVPGPDSIA